MAIAAQDSAGSTKDEIVKTLLPQGTYEELADNIAFLRKALTGMKGVCSSNAVIVKEKIADSMARRLPKERLQSNRTTTAAISEFKYANYEIASAEEDYKKTVEEITALQTALDLINNTETFEIDV